MEWSTRTMDQMMSQGTSQLNRADPGCGAGRGKVKLRLPGLRRAAQRVRLSEYGRCQPRGAKEPRARTSTVQRRPHSSAIEASASWARDPALASTEVGVGATRSTSSGWVEAGSCSPRAALPPSRLDAGLA